MEVKQPRSKHIIANTLAGLFVGVGLSLMMTLYGVVGWSTSTPNLIIVAGVLLGLGVGLLPVRTTGVRTSTRSSAKRTSPYS
jgi:F0F1-type ATP synthase assembly protein I